MAEKILYLWQAQYPWDVRVEKICNALQNNGFEVEILARQGKDEPAFAVTNAPENIPIHRVGPPGPLSVPIPGNPIWSKAIQTRIRKFKPDLVIARDIPLALPAEKACKKANIPLVIDMAEHYPVAMRTWKKYQSRFYWRFLINTLRLPDQIEKRSVRRAQGIMTVCEEQKQRLVHDYGCDAERITAILNTPELSKIPTQTTSQRKRTLFGYHGVVIQDRDLITVIRGFDLAAESEPELRLVIYGGGESIDDIKNEIKRARFSERISVMGSFKPTELPRLYSEVDFGIVSWKVNEFTNNTIANKFFDYAAYGKPILYTRTRPMDALMKTMGFGIGFDKEDPVSASKAMKQLMNSPYDELSKRGRSAVEKEFNWSEDTKRMILFLREILKKELRKTR
jgi:glycosyltransferase involved in cell wall biosynthesis